MLRLDDLISESTVRALGSALGEPAWLTEERARHWRAAAGAAHPTLRDEDWRRTPEEFLDLAPVLAPLAAAPAAALPTAGPATARAEAPKEAEEGPEPAWPPSAARLLGWDGAGSAGILVQEGRRTRWRLRSDVAAAGVYLGDLGAAARERPSLLASHPLAESFPPGESFLSGLILALGAGGLVLHAPADVRVQEPFLVVARPAPGEPLPVLRPCLVVAGPGARLRVVEVLAGRSDESSPGPGTAPCPAAPAGAVAASGAAAASGALFLGSLLALHLAEGAEVEYVSVQAAGDVRCFAARRAWLLEGARLRWHLIESGGRMARSEAHAWLAGDGAAAETACILAGSGTQHLDLSAGAVHRGSRTRSRLLVHAAAAGEARTLFRGNGHIHRGAAGADLDQRHRTLLLSPQARTYSRPALVIDEHDVRASHGAAASPLDPEEIFYLMSRGLPEPAAGRLVVEGFLRAALAGLPSPLDGEALLAALAAKLTEKGAAR